jgi:cytochrome c peroxidase
MRKLTVVFFSMFFVALSINAQEFNFIGVKKCSMCHKSEKQGSQLPIWEKSAHANAYKTLQTEEADKIAAEKGFETKAVETDACLKCHVTGHGLPEARFEKGFDIADGVQCEACHGPGSEYKSMKIMKDQAAAVKAGLVIYADDAAIEAKCKTCHNEESPTYKEFKFAEMYEKIKHNIPEK